MPAPGTLVTHDKEHRRPASEFLWVVIKEVRREKGEIFVQMKPINWIWRRADNSKIHEVPIDDVTPLEAYGYLAKIDRDGHWLWVVRDPEAPVYAKRTWRQPLLGGPDGCNIHPSVVDLVGASVAKARAA